MFQVLSKVHRIIQMFIPLAGFQVFGLRFGPQNVRADAETCTLQDDGDVTVQFRPALLHQVELDIAS